MKKKNKSVWLKEDYYDKLSDQAIGNCRDMTDIHELTGGTFRTRLIAEVEVFGVVCLIPYVDLFSDKCSCPLPIKKRCSKEIVLITYLN